MNFGDRSGRQPRWIHRAQGFTGTVGEELTRLRGRRVGACEVCGRSVFAAQSFTRLKGRVVHVRCPIAPARSPAIEERWPTPGPRRRRYGPA
jgi:hypothetical protein